MKRYIPLFLTIICTILLTACSSKKDNTDGFLSDTVRLEQWERSGGSILKASVTLTEPESVEELWTHYQAFSFDGGTISDSRIAYIPSIIVIFTDSTSGEHEQFTIYETSMGTACQLEDEAATFYVLQDNASTYHEFLGYFQTDSDDSLQK